MNTPQTPEPLGRIAADELRHGERDLREPAWARVTARDHDLAREARYRRDIQRAPVRVLAQVDERLRVGDRDAPNRLRDLGPSARPENDLLEEAAGAACNIPRGELILDAAKRRLDRRHRDQPEQRRLMGDHAANELRLPAGKRERDRSPIGGPHEMRGFVGPRPRSARPGRPRRCGAAADRLPARCGCARGGHSALRD